VVARAQQDGRVRRIGVLSTVRIVAAVILAIVAAGVADRRANAQTPGSAIGPEAAACIPRLAIACRRWSPHS